MLFSLTMCLSTSPCSFFNSYCSSAILKSCSIICIAARLNFSSSAWFILSPLISVFLRFHFPINGLSDRVVVLSKEPRDLSGCITSDFMKGHIKISVTDPRITAKFASWLSRTINSTPCTHGYPHFIFKFTNFLFPTLVISTSPPAAFTRLELSPTEQPMATAKSVILSWPYICNAPMRASFPLNRGGFPLFSLGFQIGPRFPLLINSCTTCCILVLPIPLPHYFPIYTHVRPLNSASFDSLLTSSLVFKPLHMFHEEIHFLLCHVCVFAFLI